MRTPHERALLAAILGGAHPDDANGVTPDSFYDPRDAQIWRAMVELSAEGVRPDVAMLSNRVPAMVAPDYLAALPDQNVHPRNIRQYAAEVVAKAARRSLIDVAHDIHAAADSDRPVNDIVENARAALDRTVINRQDTQTLAEIFPAMLAHMKGGRYTGLSTPWPGMDDHIVGLQPGRLYCIAARPGVGKSLMAQNLAEHMAATHKKRVYFSTLEMQPEELAIRFLSSAIAVDSKRLQAGSLTHAEWQLVEAAGMAGFADLPIDICATSTQTVETIRSGVRDSARKGELGLVIVDYLQLMEGAGKDKTRAEVVAGFSRGLKNLASEFRVPVIALSQLNRAANGAPTLANLRESGAIEQDSDVVILMSETDTPGVLDVEVAKARNGTMGTFQLWRYGHYSKLTDPDASSPLAGKPIP